MRGWSTWGTLAVLWAGFAHAAGVRSLRSSADGSEALVVIDLARKGLDEPGQGRLFRIGANGITLATGTAAADRDVRFAEPGGSQVLTYDATFPCIESGLVLCARAVGTYSFFYPVPPGPSGSTLGYSRISRNGRFTVAIAKTSISTLTQVNRTDRETGMIERLLVQGNSLDLVSHARAVADDGTIVAINSPSVVYRNGRWIQPPNANGRSAISATIDASGQSVVYRTNTAELRLFRPDDNTDTLLASGDADYRDPDITAAGARIAFLAIPGPRAPGNVHFQLFVMNIGGSASRYTNEPLGIQRFSLSDDGRFVWYVTGAGEVVRLDISTGQTERFLNVPTSSATASAAAVPGSLFALNGITRDARILINGTPVSPTIQTEFTQWIQIPWEFPNTGTARVSVETDSQFLPLSVDVPLKPVAPSLIGGPFHQDWRSTVSFSNPSRRGEFLHFYLLGLGEVYPSVGTGQPAPSQHLSQLVHPPVCNWEVAYAGLAPGLTGIYQFTARVPQTATGTVLMECSGSYSTYLPVE